MASYNARLNSTETKNVFLHHISTDIKEIQDAQCNVSTHMDQLGGSSKLAQLLCDHLDHILMHGLHKSTEGYWPCVVFFTHTITVKEIKALVNVNTNIGRGRSWLNIALNEQVVESYLRMFIDNQSHVKFFYAKEAFLRDVERLSLLLTLISGLDFVSFNLPIDEGYLNISASPSVSNSGIDFSVKPSFVAAVTPKVANRRDLTVSDTHALSTSPSPSHSPLTSSLPPNIHMALHTTVETQSDAKLQEENLSTPLNQTVSGVESESKETEDKKIETVTTDNVIDEVKEESSLPQAKAPQLSFFDRYNQLADQENDMISEIVSVSKKKKSTKGKKRRIKKKDGSSSNEVMEISKEQKKEKRSSSPQLLIESVKENWPPVMDEEETPVINSEEPLIDNDLDKELEPVDVMDELTKENRIEESIKVVVHNDTPPLITDVPNNPFDDFNTLSQAFEQETDTNPFVEERTTNPIKEEKEEERKTSYEYEFGGFGNSMSTSDQSSDYNELLDGAAAFVKRKRSPQHAINKERNVAVEDDIREQGTVEDTADSSKLTLDLSEIHTVTYSGPPERPLQITDSERHSFDVAINDNTRIVLSLDVFHHSKEKAVRLVQAYVPQGPGRYQKVCVVVTDGAVYLTQDDGTEGVFSHMMGVSYSMLDSIMVGLSWQWFSLKYKEKTNETVKQQQQVVITGSEAVTRSIIDTIKDTATTSLKLEKDDDSRTEAIEKELIKLGSETSMEIVRYCMVYWEQLSGEPPLLSPPADISIPISGTLSVKTDNLLFIKIQSWSEGFFQLIDGVLHHFNSENDKSPKSSYPLRGLKCGGCTRAAGENKDYAFKVLDSNGSSLVLAAEDEEDMTRWMQALCLATIGEEEASIKSPIQKGGAYCAVLLTQNKIHVLKEDWSNGTVQLMTSISVQDVNEICVEQALPVYCTLRYDDWENETQGTWMLCFSSEYELGQFERSLLKKYKEIFQVDLEFSELSDSATRSRVHQAIELMRASRSRSDSITRGRTVFSFDQN